MWLGLEVSFKGPLLTIASRNWGINIFYPRQWSHLMCEQNSFPHVMHDIIIIPSRIFCEISSTSHNKPTSFAQEANNLCMMKPGSNTHNLRPRMHKMHPDSKRKRIDISVMILTPPPPPPPLPATHEDWISCELFEGVGAFGDYCTHIHFYCGCGWMATFLMAMFWFYVHKGPHIPSIFSILEGSCCTYPTQQWALNPQIWKHRTWGCS